MRMFPPQDPPSTTGHPILPRASTAAQMRRVLGALLATSMLLEVAGCHDGEPLGLPKVAVNGRVVDLRGLPLPGVSVTILGRPTVESDSNGEFTVNDVMIPYDAVMTRDGLYPAPFAYVTVYEGLRRSDPTLTPIGQQGAAVPGYNAQVGGTVGGALFTPNQPAGYRTLVDFESSEVPWVDAVTIPGGATGTYSLRIPWTRPEITVGRLHALQMQLGTDGQPVHFPGYGTRPGVALSGGLSLSGQDVTLEAIQQSSVSGTLSVPAGATATPVYVNLDFGHGCYQGMALGASSSPNAPEFTAATPVIPGALICVAAGADFGVAGYTVAGRRFLSPGTSGLDLTFPAPPAPRSPPDGAIDVTTATVFTWSGFAGGVHLFYVSFEEMSFIVLTSRTSLTLPDLEEMGRSAPRGTQGRWCVAGAVPEASTDELAGAPGTVWSLLIGGNVNGAMGWGGCRTFTTAP